MDNYSRYADNAFRTEPRHTSPQGRGMVPYSCASPGAGELLTNPASPSSIKKSVVRKTPHRCAVCRVVCRVVGHSLLLLGIPSSSFTTPLTFSIQHFGLVTSKAPRSNQVAVHRRNEASVKCVSEVRLRSCR